MARFKETDAFWSWFWIARTNDHDDDPRRGRLEHPASRGSEVKGLAGKKNGVSLHGKAREVAVTVPITNGHGADKATTAPPNNFETFKQGLSVFRARKSTSRLRANAENVEFLDSRDGTGSHVQLIFANNGIEKEFWNSERLLSRAGHKVLFTSFEHRWAPRSAQTARYASGIAITMANSAINIRVLNGAFTEETQRLNGSAAPLYD
ncbi:hypothetical protein B0H13DRAFT_1877011 [Mycena leptocephala]|nr:hypothetical protein B0H13DRAFT_1877011 [Mycena leptocephala]